jgi:Fe-S-cluster containining protein
MDFDLIQIHELAKNKEDENWRFRQFLKTRCKLDSDEIDRVVFETTQRVWAGIDCIACANCCRHVHPTFSEEDVERLARRLEMDIRQFTENYLERTKDSSANPWQTHALPCPFLKDNCCSVYEDRPADCRGYPYLYEPEFESRTMAMIDRTFTCPIVYEVIEELKGSLRFSGKRRH